LTKKKIHFTIIASWIIFNKKSPAKWHLPDWGKKAWQYRLKRSVWEYRELYRICQAKTDQRL